MSSSSIGELAIQEYALASRGEPPLDGDPVTALSSCVHIETEYFAQFQRRGLAGALCERLVESPTLIDEQRDAVLAALGCWLRAALECYNPNQPHWLEMIKYATGLAERISSRGHLAAESVLRALAAELVAAASVPDAPPADLRLLLWAVDTTLGHARRSVREAMLPQLNAQLQGLMTRCAGAGDLRTQRALLSVVLRFVPRGAAARSDAFLLLCPAALCADATIKNAFCQIDYTRFLHTSRHFLMVLNRICCGVEMVLCQSAYIDDIQLHPLGSDANDSLWLDLNPAPRTVTLEWNPACVRDCCPRPLCADLLGEHATLTVCDDTLDRIEVTREEDGLLMHVEARWLGVFEGVESPSQQRSMLRFRPTGDFTGADRALRDMFGSKYNCALSPEALETPCAPKPCYVGAPLSDDEEEEFNQVSTVAAGPRLNAAKCCKAVYNSLGSGRSQSVSPSSVSTTSLLNLPSKVKNMKKYVDHHWQAERLELKPALEPFREERYPVTRTYKCSSVAPINQNVDDVSSVLKDQTEEEFVNNLFYDATKKIFEENTDRDLNCEKNNLTLPDNGNIIVKIDNAKDPAIPDKEASDYHVEPPSKVLSPRVLLERLELKQITIVDQDITERITLEKSNNVIHDTERNGDSSCINTQCDVSNSQVIPETPNTLEVSFSKLSCKSMTTACKQMKSPKISSHMSNSSSNTLDVKIVSPTVEKKNKRAPIAGKKKIQAKKKLENTKVNLEDPSSNFLFHSKKANSDSPNSISIMPDTSCKAAETEMLEKPVYLKKATKGKKLRSMVTPKGAVCHIPDSDDPNDICVRKSDVTLRSETPTQTKKKRKLYSPKDDLIVQTVNRMPVLSQDNEENNSKNTRKDFVLNTVVITKKPKNKLSTDELFDQIRGCSNILADNLQPKESNDQIYNYTTDSEKDFVEPFRFRRKRLVSEESMSVVTVSTNKRTKRTRNKLQETSRKRVGKKAVVKIKIDPGNKLKQHKSALDDEKMRKAVLSDAGLDTSICFESCVQTDNLYEDIVPIGLQNTEMEEILPENDVASPLLISSEMPKDAKILRKLLNTEIDARKSHLQAAMTDKSCEKSTTTKVLVSRTHANSPYMNRKEIKNILNNIIETYNISSEETCNAKKIRNLTYVESNQVKDVKIGQTGQVGKSVNLSKGSGKHMNTTKENTLEPINIENVSNQLPKQHKHDDTIKKKAMLGDSNIDYDEIITEPEWQARSVPTKSISGIMEQNVETTSISKFTERNKINCEAKLQSNKVVKLGGKNLATSQATNSVSGSVRLSSDRTLDIFNNPKAKKSKKGGNKTHHPTKLIDLTINRRNHNAQTKVVEVCDVISQTKSIKVHSDSSDDEVLSLKKGKLFNKLTRKNRPSKASAVSDDKVQKCKTTILDDNADKITRLCRSRAVKDNVTSDTSNEIINQKNKTPVADRVALHKRRISMLNVDLASNSSDHEVKIKKIKNTASSQHCYKAPRKYQNKIIKSDRSDTKTVKPKKNWREEKIEMASMEKANTKATKSDHCGNLNIKYEHGVELQKNNSHKMRKTVKAKIAKSLFEETEESPLPPLVIEQDQCNDRFNSSFTSLTDLIKKFTKPKRQRTCSADEPVLNIPSSNNNSATNIACSTPRNKTLNKQSCLTIDSSGVDHSNSAIEKSIITNAYPPITGHGDFNESPPNTLHLKNNESGRRLERDLENPKDRQYILEFNDFDSSRQQVDIDDLENESTSDNRQTIKRQLSKRKGNNLSKRDISSNESKFRKSVNLLKNTKTSFSPISNTSDVFFRVVKPVLFSPITPCRPIRSSCSVFTTSYTDDVRNPPQVEDSEDHDSQFFTKCDPSNVRSSSTIAKTNNVNATDCEHSDQGSESLIKCKPPRTRNSTMNAKRVGNSATHSEHSDQDLELLTKCEPLKRINSSIHAKRDNNIATHRKHSDQNSESLNKSKPPRTRNSNMNAKRVGNSATHSEHSDQDLELLTKCEPPKRINSSVHAKRVNNIATDREHSDQNSESLNKCKPPRTRNSSVNAKRVNDNSTYLDDVDQNSDIFTKCEPSKTGNSNVNAGRVDSILDNDKNCYNNNNAAGDERTHCGDTEAWHTVLDMRDAMMQTIETGLLEPHDVTNSVWAASIMRMLQEWRELQRRHAEAQSEVKREAERRLDELQRRAGERAEEVLERLKRELLQEAHRRRAGAELRVRLLREDLAAHMQRYRRRQP